MSKTDFTQSGKIRYWHKFAIVIAVALVLLLVCTFVQSGTLKWLAGGVFLISMWYGILAMLEMVDKINN